MAEQRGCPTCKHQALDGDEEPCLHCLHAYTNIQDDIFDCYEPIPKPNNGDWLRTLNNDQLSEFLAGLMGTKCLKSMLYAWLQKERKVD